MNESSDFSYSDLDYNFLDNNEKIICSHCIVISYVEFSSAVEQEVVDFSHYNFKEGTGFVVWSNYYSNPGIAELSFHNNCMISQKCFIDGTNEFYWWPAGTITFLEDVDE